jgi:hypothetical protein
MAVCVLSSFLEACLLLRWWVSSMGGEEYVGVAADGSDGGFVFFFSS